MNQEERRKWILEYLRKKGVPVSGAELAKQCGVSRQIIVQDIASLRANGHEIWPTCRGYLSRGSAKSSRVFQVKHSDTEIEEELQVIVDNGGIVRDVYVEHEVYGCLRAELDLGSRREIGRFLDEIQSGKSSPLKNVTRGIHFHTVEAESEEILDQIERELKERGYLISEKKMELPKGT